MDSKKSITRESASSETKNSIIEKQPQSQPGTWTVSGNPVDYYANAIHVEWTLYDVRMRFGQLMFVGDPSLFQQTVDERARITLAWAAAKAMRDSLTDVIARHERMNGEIKPLTIAPAE